MRLRYNIGQLLLLTALAGLVVALFTAVYARARGMFQPEAVSYSPAGDALAARYSDGTVTVWNRQGKQLGSFDTRDGWVNFFDLTTMQLASEQRVVTVDSRQQFDVWNVSSGEREKSVAAIGMNPFFATSVISGDGSTAASVTVGAQNVVEIHDLQSGAKVGQIDIGAGTPFGLALNEDGSRLSVINLSSEVAVWDLASEEVVAGPHALPLDVEGVPPVVSPDLRVAAAVGPGFYSSDYGQAITLLDINTGQRAVITTPEPVHGLQLSPDGLLLAAQGADNAVTVIDTQTGDEACRIEPGYKTPLFEFPEELNLSSAPAIAFSPAGEEVLIGSNIEVGVFDAKTGRLKKRLWTSRHALSGWFFAPALMGWAAAWGVARRRARQSERKANEGEVIDAELAPDDAQPEGAAELVAREPPTSLKAAWVLLAVGGVVAVVWGTLIIFSQLSCLALTPFPYYSLYAGVLAISAAAGRRTDKLPLVYSVQMGNIICCDTINFCLGIAGIVLRNRIAAAQYVEATAQ